MKSELCLSILVVAERMQRRSRSSGAERDKKLLTHYNYVWNHPFSCLAASMSLNSCAFDRSPSSIVGYLRQRGRRGLWTYDAAVVFKAPLATARAPLRVGSVHLFVRLLVCLFVSHLERLFLLTTNRKSYMGFSKNSLLTPKIQDGGHPPSWKSSNRQMPTKKYPILMKFGTRTVDMELDDSHVTKYECFRIFLEFKMAESCHIENRFLATTQQPIGQFQWNFAWGSSFFCRISEMGQIPAFNRTCLVFLKQFGLRQAAPFVSCPIHLSMDASHFGLEPGSPLRHRRSALFYWLQFLSR